MVAWNMNFFVWLGLVFGGFVLLYGMFGKKVKKRDSFKVFGGTVLGFAVVSMLVMNFGTIMASMNTQPGGGGGMPPISVVPVVSSCGDDNLGTLYGRAEDVGASTLTFLASTIYASDASTGQLTPYSRIMGTTSPAWTTINGTSATTVPCGMSYVLEGVTTAGSIASTEAKTVVMDKEIVNVDFDTYDLADLQAYVKDLDTDAQLLLAADNIIGGNSSSAFHDVNSTLITAVANGADIAVGTDGYINTNIQLKSDTSNQYATEPGKPFFVCVDSGTENEWQEPVVSWQGTKISSYTDASKVRTVKSAMDTPGTYVSNAEWCYRIDDHIGDVAKNLGFYIKARSGQNPDTSNDDIAIAILGEGKYSSSLSAEIKDGVYTDASTPVLVVSSALEVPLMTFQIS